MRKACFSCRPEKSSTPRPDSAPDSEKGPRFPGGLVSGDTFSVRREDFPRKSAPEHAADQRSDVAGLIPEAVLALMEQERATLDALWK